MALWPCPWLQRMFGGSGNSGPTAPPGVEVWVCPEGESHRSSSRRVYVLRLAQSSKVRVSSPRGEHSERSKPSHRPHVSLSRGQVSQDSRAVASSYERAPVPAISQAIPQKQASKHGYNTEIPVPVAPQPPPKPKSPPRYEQLPQTYQQRPITSDPVPSSHFLAFPVDTSPTIIKAIERFHNGLLADKDRIRGFHETIIMDRPRLHFTVGLVGLEDELGPRGQSTPLQRVRRTVSSALALLNELQPQIAEIIRDDGDKLEVNLDKLDITQATNQSPRDGHFAHVLYVGPSVGGTIKKVMDHVYYTFKDAGYITENRSAKIHCTLLNSKYRKPRYEREAFSYADILRSPACQHLGMQKFKGFFSDGITAQQIALGTVQLKEIQLWRMGSHEQGTNRYISEGGVKF